MDNDANILQQAIDKIDRASTQELLEQARVFYLGKNGLLNQRSQSLKDLSLEEKREAGKKLNALKQAIMQRLDEKQHYFTQAMLDQRLSAEKLDITLPARPFNYGTVHPISKVCKELEDIFIGMGFDILEGPEIEDDFHNFTALNTPPDHPARQMQDTFYLPPAHGNNVVLRTQTSSVQIRGMENGKPPYRFVTTGPVYRSDYDATHTPMFHQIEGLYVDTHVSLAQMKHCLHQFLRLFFEVDSVPMKWRVSYFPFTEPSAEVDIRYTNVDNCFKIGTGDKWLEIFGCGMVHPNVLRNVGLDPDKYSGFAFGCGIERLAMLKYGVNDMRRLFESDLRFLRHYGFSFFQ